MSESGAWIFQATPRTYRILEALRDLDRLPYQVTRYRDQIRMGDPVLLWVAGKHAGIYALARVVEGVEERVSALDAAYWLDPGDGARPGPRVVLEIERRFLGTPLLKGCIAATSGLEGLSILKNPRGTNFRVKPEEWSILRRLLPEVETREPSPELLAWAQRMRGRA